MLQTSCEQMKFKGLPTIRKEIVKSMINTFGLTQKEAAEKIGITPAAVCQYLSRKRSKISVVNNDILIEINISAEKIIKQGESAVNYEICRVCKILREQGLLSFSAID